MTGAPGALTRDRIVLAATRLFQQRGYHAVTTADILGEARAPKGSMYHHFPLGKEQIAIAAVARIRGEVRGLLDRLAADGRPLDDAIRSIAEGMARWLRASGWREGTMLASAAIGAVPDRPRLHAAIRDALDDWRDHLSARLVDAGWSRPGARAMAQTVLAGLEGAMLLARIEQDERVVTRVAASLARLLAAGEAGAA